MKKYLVIGNPIEHSLSPQLHNYWIKQNNLDAVYEKKQLNESDIEGIAIAKTGAASGYLIVSDQQRGLFNVYDRKTNAFITAINLTTLETDGCDVVTTPLGSAFPKGIFVAMNDAKNFYVYDFGKLEQAILSSTQKK